MEVVLQVLQLGIAMVTWIRVNDSRPESESLGLTTHTHVLIPIYTSIQSNLVYIYIIYMIYIFYTINISNMIFIIYTFLNYHLYDLYIYII